MQAFRTAVLLLCLAFVAPAAARMIPSLHPSTYHSASGLWTLTVDPDDRSGAGGASYTVRDRRGSTWKGRRAYALRHAAISDSGTWGGVAYSLGLDPAGHDRPGDMVMTVSAPDGTVVREYRHAREPTRYIHGLPTPTASGVFIDGEQSTLVVRIGGQCGDVPEYWWLQPLDGRPHEEITPEDVLQDPGPCHWLDEVRPLAGTPLVLTAWKSSGRDADAMRFVATNLALTTAWQASAPGEDDDDTNDKDWDKAVAALDGQRIATGPEGRFTLTLASGRKTLHLRAISDAATPGGWHVVETQAPSAWSPPAAAAAAATLPPLSLEQLETISLRGRSRSHPIRSVQAFAISAAQGSIGIVRHDPVELPVPALLVVDEHGSTLEELPLPANVHAEFPRWRLAWLRDAQWLLVTDAYREDGKHRAYLADTAAQTLRELPVVPMDSVEALTSLPGARFALLAVDHQRHTMSSMALVHDLDGMLLWRLDEESDGPGALFSPEALAPAPDGGLLVLDNIRHTVQRFDAHGQHRGTIDLERAWGREPNYPSELAALPDGGLILGDFNGQPPVVLMSADGMIRTAVEPRHGDGRRFRTPQEGVLAAPDGRLWTTDGDVLMRLDETGLVDRVLGDPLDSITLETISALALGPKHDIYAADAQTGAVHVFDRSGQRLRICAPDPGDHNEQIWFPSLTVTDAGVVWVTRGSDRHEAEFVQYDAECLRTGVARLELDPISQHVLAQRGTSNLWVLGYRALFLATPEGKSLRRIERSAAKRWLEDMGPAATAADGSIAVQSETGTMLHRPEAAIAIFDAAGKPTHAFPTPHGAFSLEGAMDFDGRHIALLVERPDRQVHVALLHRDGRPIGEFTTGASNPDKVLFVPGKTGPELWVLHDGGDVLRYALDSLER